MQSSVNHDHFTVFKVEQGLVRMGKWLRNWTPPKLPCRVTYLHPFCLNRTSTPLPPCPFTEYMWVTSLSILKLTSSLPLLTRKPILTKGCPKSINPGDVQGPWTGPWIASVLWRDGQRENRTGNQRGTCFLTLTLVLNAPRQVLCTVRLRTQPTNRHQRIMTDPWKTHICNEHVCH